MNRGLEKLERSIILALFSITLGILCIILSFTIPFSHFLPAWKHWDGNYLIEPGQSNETTIDFFQGTVIEGTLVIIGENNDGYFSLTDSFGDIIVTRTNVSNRHYFGPFHLSRNSQYTLTFNNNESLDKKSVYWIVRAYWYELTFKILSVWLLTIGIIVYLYNSANAHS